LGIHEWFEGHHIVSVFWLGFGAFYLFEVGRNRHGTDRPRAKE